MSCRGESAEVSGAHEVGSGAEEHTFSDLACETTPSFSSRYRLDHLPFLTSS